MAIEPIRYELYPSNEALASWVCGRITFNTMTTYIADIVSNPDFTRTMHGLYDLTACTDIDGDLNDLSLFAAILNNHDEIPDKTKTAIIIPNDNEKILRIVRGLILMVSSSNIEHQYFRESDRGKAYDFLGFSPALVNEIENNAIVEYPISLKQRRSLDAE